jgi:hypothetical protein
MKRNMTPIRESQELDWEGEHMESHNKDCELGDNWKDCAACVEHVKGRGEYAHERIGVKWPDYDTGFVPALIVNGESFQIRKWNGDEVEQNIYLEISRLARSNAELIETVIRQVAERDELLAALTLTR